MIQNTALKAAIIQHEKSTPPGSVIQWLNEKEIPFQLFTLFESPQLPTLDQFEVLVICGGSMNVDQESSVPWMKAEKLLIKSAIDQKKCLIGLCLGAQLIAECLGAKVGPHSTTEVGWLPIKLTPTQEFDNPESLVAFQWHSYSFEIPAGAVRFASSEACENQAYSLSQQIVAFQFHPETTKDWAIECAHDSDLPAVGPYSQSKEQIIQGLHHQPALQKWFFNNLDQHLKSYQKRYLS